MVNVDVLVLGGAGWTGSCLMRQLAARGLTVAAPRSSELDVTLSDDVDATVDRLRPTAVINLAAAQPGATERTLDLVNRVGAENVASAAARVGARLVHVASDVVFDGRGAPYDEEAAVCPITPYGRSKAAGEAAVLAAHPAAVSVRTSLLWDRAELDRGTAGFARRLAAAEPCSLFVDEIRSPIPRDVLARCLAELLDISVRGPLHVAGTEPVSRHEFGVLLLEHFGVPGRERVVAVSAAQQEAAGAAPRPRDLRLDVRRAEQLLGVALPGVRDVLSSGGS
jgi:dTDP-4-dehydrorhamnose reductase